MTTSPSASPVLLARLIELFFDITDLESDMKEAVSISISRAV